MKFTGKFKDLSRKGFVFQKLYARNFKSYRKRSENYCIWIWVRDREIEVDDWYNCTEGVLAELRKVEWNSIEPSRTFNLKYVTICFDREEPENGFLCVHGMAAMNLMLQEQHEYNKNIRIDEAGAIALLEEIDNLCK